MIYCKDYKDKGLTKLSNGVTKRMVFVELYCDTQPSSLAIDPADVTGVPALCPFEDMQFAPGSVLVATTDNKVFLCGTDGTFVAF